MRLRPLFFCALLSSATVDRDDREMQTVQRFPVENTLAFAPTICSDGPDKAGRCRSLSLLVLTFGAGGSSWVDA